MTARITSRLVVSPPMARCGDKVADHDDAEHRDQFQQQPSQDQRDASSKPRWRGRGMQQRRLESPASARALGLVVGFGGRGGFAAAPVPSDAIRGQAFKDSDRPPHRRGDPYWTPAAQARATASASQHHQLARAAGFVAMTSTQPYSNGRLCTVFSVSMPRLPGWLTTPTQTPGSGRRDCPGRAAFSGPSPGLGGRWFAATGAAARRRRRAGGGRNCRVRRALMIAFRVAAKAARLAGSFRTSSAARACRGDWRAPASWWAPDFCASAGAG